MHRPDLTEAALVNVAGQNGLFYRTGDLVRLDPKTKRLYFVGRKDFQIKLRGQRIECGEIEHVLCQFTSPSTSGQSSNADGIKQTIITKCEHLGMEHLVAYILRSNATKEVQIQANCKQSHMQASLRAHCEMHLPLHMVPSFFIVLDQFPLNNNGKVNRKALPLPNFSELLDQTREEAVIQPRTETEQQVLNVWKEYLNLDNISVTSNFFSLGGNSLLFIRLINRYRHEFAQFKTSPMGNFFKKPTIVNHALLLDEFIA